MKKVAGVFLNFLKKKIPVHTATKIKAFVNTL